MLNAERIAWVEPATRPEGSKALFTLIWTKVDGHATGQTFGRKADAEREFRRLNRSGAAPRAIVRYVNGR